MKRTSECKNYFQSYFCITENRKVSDIGNVGREQEKEKIWKKKLEVLKKNLHWHL